MIRRKEEIINLKVVGNRVIPHKVREEYETVEDMSSIFK